MHPNARIGIDKGNAAEQRDIKAYNNGESGSYIVDYMRAISETGVIFGGFFNHDERRHCPDGYVQVGRVMHIFEMKDGAKANMAHTGQVNRYAHVMNIYMDFDSVVTHIVYGSRKEAVIEHIDANDIAAVYAATRGADDVAYSWKKDHADSMTAEDKEARNKKDRDRRANRSHAEEIAEKASIRKRQAAFQARRKAAKAAGK